jgi:hypothetical protein
VFHSQSVQIHSGSTEGILMTRGKRGIVKDIKIQYKEARNKLF